MKLPKIIVKPHPESLLFAAGCLYFILAPLREIFQPFLWVLVLLMCGLIPFVKNARSLVVNYSTVPIFILLLYYLTAAVANHGSTAYLIAYRMVRVLPFYVLGYFLAKNYNRFLLMLLAIVGGQTIGSMFRLPIYLLGPQRSQVAAAANLQFGDIGASSLIQVDSGLSQARMVYLFLFNKGFIVTVALTTILGIILFFRTKSKKLRVLIGTALIICVALVFNAKMSSPIIMLFIGLLSIALLKAVKSTSFSKFYFSVLGMVIFFCSITFVLLNPDAFGLKLYDEGFGKIRKLIEGLLANGSFLDVINQATNSRLEITQKSWSVFLQEPLFGIGAYAWTSNDKIGGHNSYADSFAQFGLFGTIPMLYMFGYWLLKALNIPKSSRWNLERTVLISFWIVYMIGCFFDPLFLSGRPDAYIFLMAGITCRLSFISRLKKSYIS